MSDSDTLLAHLVPTLTSRNEDTATEALAYVLDKSTDCRAALGRLVAGGGFVISIASLTMRSTVDIKSSG